MWFISPDNYDGLDFNNDVSRSEAGTDVWDLGGALANSNAN